MLRLSIFKDKTNYCEYGHKECQEMIKLFN